MASTSVCIAAAWLIRRSPISDEVPILPCVVRPIGKRVLFTVLRKPLRQRDRAFFLVNPRATALRYKRAPPLDWRGSALLTKELLKRG